MPYLSQEFRIAAQQATNSQLIFIDPEQFTGDKDHDFYNFKKQLTEQTGVPSKDLFFFDSKLEDSDSRAEIDEIIETIREAGPAAANIRVNDDFKCLIIDSRSYEDIENPSKSLPFKTKEDIVAVLANVDKKYLKDLPGNDADYIKAIAEHEAGHCNQAVGVNALDKETGSDYSALQNTPKDVAEVIIKARALSTTTGDDGIHATSVPLTKGINNNDSIETTNLAITSDIDGKLLVGQYIYQHQGDETLQIDKEYGHEQEKINPDYFEDIENFYIQQAEILHEENPKLYYEIVEANVAGGYYKDMNPISKEYALQRAAAASDLLKLDEMGIGQDSEVQQRARTALTYAKPLDAEQRIDFGKIIDDIQSNTVKDGNGGLIRSGDGSPLQRLAPEEQNIGASLNSFNSVAANGIKSSIDLGGDFKVASIGNAPATIPNAPQFSANDANFNVMPNGMG